MNQTDTSPSTAAISSFLELSPDAVAIVNDEGTIVAANDGLSELTGRDLDELVGSTIETLVPARMRTRHVRKRLGFAENPSTRPMGRGQDLWLETSTGTEVAVDIALRPVPSGQGSLVAAVIRDVSAGRAVQERLVRTEDRMRGMLEAQHDGIVVMRAIRDESGELADMVIEYANAAASTILHLPMEALIGLQVLDVAGSDDPGLLDYRELLRTGERMTHFADWNDPQTGELIGILEVRGALAGKDRIVASFRNVLEQRRAAERIEAMNEELRQANEALEDAAEFQRDFISASSHELRTPLTAMTGFAELLVLKWDEMNDERRRHAAEAVLRNAQRQLSLVNDLAHAAHLQSGRLVLDPRTISIDNAIHEALASVPDAEAFAAPAPSGLQVQADEGRVIQIVINLVSNAIRYGSEPYGLMVSDLGDRVQLCVLDGGNGVSPEFVPRLFDAFAQASRGVRREAKGTGLGLYISKSLAEAMGGDLRYQRLADGRTCFELKLPKNQG